MLLQKTETCTDDLGFVVEAPIGNKPINQFLKMWGNDFAHTSKIFR